MPKPVNKKYDASAIKWFKGMEGTRKRLSVYLGRNADTLGIQQTAFEIVGNALDETTNGHGDTVGVKIDGDIVTVFDNGRGIPTGPHPEHKGMDTLTILATEMHAGGKLEADAGNYNTSIGCFVGSTKIKLVNGNSVTIEKLARDFQKTRQMQWVCAFNKESNRAFIERQAYGVFATRTTIELTEVSLDNGSVIKCTPDHPFMRWNGDYLHASDLDIGMVLRGVSFTDGVPVEPAKMIKVTNVRSIKLKKPVQVYGMSVEQDHNYLLDAGVFVKNTNGMGLAVVNAASSSLIIWSIRNGKVKKQSFKAGVPTTDVVTVNATDIPKLANKPWNVKSGTVVQWVWDKTVFEKGSKLDTAGIVQSIKDMSWFAVYINRNKRIPVKFIIEANKKVIEIERKKLFNYVQTVFKSINEKDEHELMLDTAMEGFAENFDFVGAWSTHSDVKFISSVNSVKTPDGGTHLKGAMNAMFESFKKLAKRGQTFRPQDLFAGFIGCFNLRIASPIFNGQGKLALTSPEAQELSYNAVKPIIDKWIRTNKASALKIVERACAIHSVTNDMQLQKKLASALATKKGGKSLLPEQLIQSTTRNAMEREIFLVEGASSAGTCKKASDRKFQEVLPLRGKMLNVAKASKDKMGDSQVIIDMLRAIGYDPKNRETPLRVGKIMVLADPDPDGPLAPDTMIPYIDDTGVQRVDTIEYLANLQAVVDKPVLVISKTPQGTYQQSKAIDISIREYANTEYQITLSNGAVLKCTESHKWKVGTVLNTARIVTSDINGLQYLAAPYLSVGDQIDAQNSDGFLIVAAIAMTQVSYKPYYCMTVPNFGNFLVQTTGTDGTITNVVSSNCHINSLILTLLWKTVPHMFAEERVFLVKAPLFTYSTPKRKYYGSSLRDLTQQVGSKLDNTKVTRLKGWGEAQPESLREIAFNPETRELIKVMKPDQFEDEKKIQSIMGEDPNYRKKMLGV